MQSLSQLCFLIKARFGVVIAQFKSDWGTIWIIIWVVFKPEHTHSPLLCDHVDVPSFSCLFSFFSSKLLISIEIYSDGIRSKLEEFINKLDEGLRWRNGVFSLVFRVDTHFFLERTCGNCERDRLTEHKCQKQGRLDSWGLSALLIDSSCDKKVGLSWLASERGELKLQPDRTSQLLSHQVYFCTWILSFQTLTITSSI